MTIAGGLHELFPHAHRVFSDSVHDRGNICDCGRVSIATPFGGLKESGFGCEEGVTGMRLYQQTNSIYFGLDD